MAHDNPRKSYYHFHFTYDKTETCDLPKVREVVRGNIRRQSQDSDSRSFWVQAMLHWSTASWQSAVIDTGAKLAEKEEIKTNRMTGSPG